METNYDGSPQSGLANVYRLIKEGELHPIHYYALAHKIKPLVNLSKRNNAFRFKVSLM
jgi:hypothetical protein